MLRTQLPNKLLSDVAKLVRFAARVATQKWPRAQELPALLEQLDCTALTKSSNYFSDELAEHAGYLIAAAQTVFRSAADRSNAERCLRTARRLQAYA
jgi:hypothetical protein